VAGAAPPPPAPVPPQVCVPRIIRDCPLGALFLLPFFTFFCTFFGALLASRTLHFSQFAIARCPAAYYIAKAPRKGRARPSKQMISHAILIPLPYFLFPSLRIYLFILH
jgi:hypothetical protein